MKKNSEKDVKSVQVSFDICFSLLFLIGVFISHVNVAFKLKNVITSDFVQI